MLRVSTGQQARGDTEFALDAVRAEEVPRLRSILLADSLAPADEAGDQQQSPGRLLARWHPSWLRYSPLSFTGLAMIIAAVGVMYQAGLGAALEHSRLAESGRDATQRFGVVASVAVVIAVVLLVSVVLSVLRSLVTYGNLMLRRDADVLHLEHGLLRKREHTFDMRRLRGGTLRQPLLVRLLGGARLDAVMTGVAGAGEASLLLPPCPAAKAESVLTELIDDADAVSGPVRGHGAAATRRRWTRGLALPVVVAIGLTVAAASVPRAAVGVGRWWRCWPCAARCWPPTGCAGSGTASTGGGWLRARAAWNAVVTASPPRASSAGPCARRSSSGGPGWPR